MATREILLPWDSQPQEAVEIDWSNPITNGLVVCIDPFHEQSATITGTKKIATARGIAHGLYSTLGAGTTDSIQTTAAAVVTQRTILLIAAQLSNGGSGFGRIFDGNGYQVWNVDSLSNYLNSWSGSTPYWNIPKIPSTPTVCVLSYDGTNTTTGALPRVFFDGVAQTIGAASPAPSGTFRTTSGALIFGNRSDGGRGFDGSMGLILVWDRILSDAEVAAVSANPWKLFAPKRIWVPVSAGGGPSSYIFSVSGGIFFGGLGSSSHTKNLEPSGGITFSGSTNIQHTKVAHISGGVSFGGTAPITFANGSTTTYTFSVSGGISFSGTSNYNHTKTMLPTGGLTFSGNTLFTHGKGILPAGGIIFGGTNNMIFNNTVLAIPRERTKTGAGT